MMIARAMYLSAAILLSYGGCSSAHEGDFEDGGAAQSVPQAFFAAGGQGIFTSEDGYEWQRVFEATNENLVDIEYGNGLLVALGAQGKALISSNGTAWRSVDLGTSDEQLVDLAFHDGAFYAAGFNWDDGAFLWRSADGNDWQRTAGERVMPAQLIPARNGALYLSASHLGAAPENYLYDVSAEAWKEVSKPSDASYHPLATYFEALDYDSETYVSGADGTYLLGDAGAWQLASQESPKPWATDGSRIVGAIGGTTSLQISEDMENWETKPSGLDFIEFRDAAYGAGAFVFVGGTSIASSDTQAWQYTEPRNLGSSVVFVDEGPRTSDH